MSATVRWADALWLARRRTPNDQLRFWGSLLSAAVTAALLCTAGGLMALYGGDVASSIGVVRDDGTRGGVVFAVLLVALPALHLTGQTWKLGSIERRARMRQLRDAGAGPQELGRIAVADTVVPVSIGGVVGVVLLWGAIALVNLRAASLPTTADLPDGTMLPAGADVRLPGVPVLPDLVLASWWPPLLAIAVVTIGAAAAAVRSVARLDRTRRVRQGVVARVASRAARRTGRPDLLLALRRLADEPGPTTRPAMLLGLAALVTASSTWLNRQYRLSMGQQWLEDPFFRQSFDLVRLATWVGITLCAIGLLVALADATFRRRRSDAAAVAAGVPVPTLRRALVLQSLVPAVPAILTGLVLGGGLAVAFTGRRVGYRFDETSGPLIPLPWAAWAIWALALLLVATLAALLASTALRHTTRDNELRIPA